MSKHFNLARIKQLTYHLLTALTLVSQCWGVRILLVEDNEVERNKYTRILEKRGFEVVTAKNGQDGLKSMKNNLAYDYIITDFQMPDMNGVAFCDILINFIKSNDLKNFYKFDPLKTKVFAHTNALTDESKQKFIKAGVDNDKIFHKNNSIENIIKMINYNEGLKLTQNQNNASLS